MKNVAAIALLTIGLAGFAAGQPSSAKPAPSPPDPAPAAIGGWKRGAKRVFPSPGLGYSYAYNYEGQPFAVTLYIYDRGLASIPDDLAGVVAQEMKDAKRQIEDVAATGAYRELKTVTDRTVTLGGQKGLVKALQSTMTYKVNDVPVVSEIYVFPYKNNFVKIRVVSRADRDQAAQKVTLAVLMSGLGEAFRR